MSFLFRFEIFGKQKKPRWNSNLFKLIWWYVKIRNIFTTTTQLLEYKGVVLIIWFLQKKINFSYKIATIERKGIGFLNKILKNIYRVILLFVYFEFNHPCEYRDIFSVITEQQLFPRRSVSMHTKIHLRFTHF